MQISLAALVLLLGPPGTTQDPAPAGQVAEKQTPQERLDSIVKRTGEALVAYNVELKVLLEAAGGDHSKIEKWPKPPFPPFLEEAVNAADDYRDTPDELRFLVWTIQNVGTPLGPHGERALVRIEVAYLASAELEVLAPLLPGLGRSIGEERSLDLAAKLEKQSPSTKMRAYAASVRLTKSLREAALDSEVFIAAKIELAALLAAADVETRTFLERSLLPTIEVREKFALGKRAPEITGVDLAGVAFKLSDYDGKVVMLDFWGDW